MEGDRLPRLRRTPIGLRKQLGTRDARHLESATELQRELAVGRVDADHPRFVAGLRLHLLQKRQELFLDGDAPRDGRLRRLELPGSAIGAAMNRRTLLTSA